MRARKVFSFLLAIICLSATLVFPKLSKEVKAAGYTYDPDAAVRYAIEHAADKPELSGDCANFVSQCLIAGGLAINKQTYTGPLYREIERVTGISWRGQDLKVDSKGYVTRDLNPGILQPGDVVFNWCDKCGDYQGLKGISPHVVICTGFDDQGRAKYCSHTNKKVDEPACYVYSHDYQGCTNKLCMKVLHFDVQRAESWLWPAEGCMIVTSNFGLRDLNGNGQYDNKHHGIDIGRKGGASGYPVRASKSGTIYSGYNQYADNTFISNGMGNYTMIDHGDGTYAVYMHMQPGNLISGYVNQGDIIGHIGNTGESYGAHLHFEIYADKNNRLSSNFNPMPTNPEITIQNKYVLPDGWASQKTTYIFDLAGGSQMTTGYDRVLPDGDYIIANTAHRNQTGYYYLDIDGDGNEVSGRNVHIWTAGADEIPDFDVWTITYSDGFYRIKQKGSNLDLDVEGASNKAGTNVIVWENNEQRWAVSYNASNTGYRIQSKLSGFSLNVVGNSVEHESNVNISAGNDSQQQSWVFIPYKPAQPIENGRYVLLSSLAEGWTMDIDGNSGDVPNNTNVQLWTDAEGISKWNSFDFTKLDNGYYKMIHAASGKAVDVEDWSTSFGMNISLYDDTGTLNQQWAIVKTETGYALIARHSGMALDVKNAKTEDGNNIIEYPFHGEKCQSWKFVPAEYSVKYNANGGSGAPAAQTKYYKHTLSLSNTEPTRDDCTFLGWATSSNSTTVTYKPGEEYKVDAALTLYAVWKSNKGPIVTPVVPITTAPITTAPITTAPITTAPITTAPITTAPITTAPITTAPITTAPITTAPITTAPITKTPVITEPPEELVFDDFVERLYKCALNRASEEGGKKFWTNEVVTGKRTGADCARYFLLEAPEFMNRNLSTEDFVETLYKTFFDRDSEADGKAFWVSSLKDGKMTRTEVVNGFIESIEWCNICARYGVKSGATTKKATIASPNAQSFATRLYTCCLGRDAEADGLEYWSLALTNLEKTGCEAAGFFFTGPEFEGFSTSNEEYINRLYKTFMDRTPRADEVEYWVGQIKSAKMSRRSVLEFFGQCEEFTNICAKYGIDRGTI